MQAFCSTGSAMDCATASTAGSHHTSCRPSVRWCFRPIFQSPRFHRCRQQPACRSPPQQQCPTIPGRGLHTCRLRCYSTHQETEHANAADRGDETVSSVEERLQRTLGNLDSLLGIPPEEEQKKGESAAAEQTQQQPVELSVSPSVIKTLAEAEAARVKEGGQKDEKYEGTITEQMQRIVEQAKKLADEPADQQGEVRLKEEFEDLLQLLRPEENVDKEDISIMKKQVFGPQTFWVTDTRLTTELTDGINGLLVMGNLRGDHAKAFDEVEAAMKKTFGEKYEVFLVEDTNLDEMDSQAGPRVAFQVVPALQARPEPTTGWQRLFAGVLLVLAFGTCVQLGMLANVSKLPKETLDWLARPENVEADALPPGLADWDPLPYLAAAFPIAYSTYGIQMVHEFGHRFAAWLRKVKLGPAFLIPNGQIGTFGGVTPLRSLVRNRRDLFDVAFAGPAAGGATALGLFIAGLVLSSGGDIPKDLLVPVPTQLFQGSLLLGSATRAVLGEQALNTANVLIHPYLIAGWAGLVGTALNCLPVGSTDGGRMMQAAYGRSVLTVTSFFTYVGLGLGLLGSSLALPFGLLVLIVQRNPEKYLQDQVTKPSDSRQLAAAILVAAAVLILLPNAPDVTDAISTSDNIFL